MEDYQQKRRSSQLHGDNGAYIEALYEQYINEPETLSAQWQRYFQDLGANNNEISRLDVQDKFEYLAQLPLSFGGEANSEDVLKQIAVMNLISAYRNLGHLVADLDPVKLREIKTIPALDYQFHGLSASDLEKEFFTAGFIDTQKLKLKEIIARLKHIYCHHIGAEFSHIYDNEERKWLERALEKAPQNGYLTNKEEKINTLKKLVAADGLEKYLHNRYVGQKRFSLEGGDALIPLVEALINDLSKNGTQEIGIAMAHRGRLNILVNILGKRPADLFAEFEGKISIGEGSGDVKYHMGYSSTLDTGNGEVDLTLAYNPSHLEFVNPVIQGSMRARLDNRGLNVAEEALPLNYAVPIQIHGDAAFANQGVIQETLQLSQVRGYEVGGTIHIIVNNQIGFTTSNLLDARSSLYSSDPAKMIQAPVLHVNGDDPEAVVFAGKIAAEYLHKFKKDVVIDLICYRRLGHNEADEPAATQPMMYKKIRAHDVPSKVYAQKLQQEALISEADYSQMIADYRSALELGENVTKTKAISNKDSLAAAWKALTKQDWTAEVDTTYPLPALSALGQEIFSVPEDFKLHPIIAKTYENRREMSAGKQDLDWGAAENLAYASLIEQGYGIRVSGEDCGRGTFSHRQAVVHDQNNGHSYTPLAQLADGKVPVRIIDSTLSECAVLGFEYGYSASAPNSLTIWEGQFGDFANGAQVIIDQFIASGETKWGRFSGLTLLLPHGYEGQGPEHSSARIERYLQLSADNNWQVCVPTTPAQIFHLLRRQVLRQFRKPLVIFSPKSLLRHKLAVSSLQDLAQGYFQEVIPEIDNLNAKKVKRVILCSGKVFYDLLQKRREENLEHIAIIRVEQLYPFPKSALKEALNAYSSKVELIWCQDEPRNQGAWRNIYEDLSEVTGHKLTYVGRKESASTATGYAKVHAQEQAALVAEALGI